MSTPKDPDLKGLEETPAEAEAEENEAEVDARAAVGEDLTDDGEQNTAEEEGLA